MKKRGWFYLALFIALQVIKTLLIKGIIDDYGEGRIEIHLNESETINFSAFSLRDGYEDLRPTVTSSRSCRINGKEEIEVMGISVNEYFGQTEPIQIINGAFLGEGAIKEGRNVVIISDELAIKLFGSDKGTGNLCRIEGTTYQVVGVYKKYKNFWDVLFDDGHECIYYPITSTAAENGEIDTLYVSLKNRADGLSIHALGEIQINDGNSYIYNELDGAKKLRSLTQAPVNIVFFFIVVYLIKIAIHLLKKAEESLKGKVIKIGLCIIVGYLLISVIIVPLYIPKEALPPYNIFDIEFYIRYLKNQRIAQNYLLELHLSNYSRTYSYVSHIILISGIIQIVVCYRVKRLFSTKTWNIFKRIN